MINEYKVIVARGAANSHQVLLVMLGEMRIQIRYGTELINPCAMELRTGIFAVNSHGMCVDVLTIASSPPNASLNAG